MSINLTPENFSKSNKPRKDSIEKWIARQIKDEVGLLSRDKNIAKSGLNVICLAGPNLYKHVNNYLPLCGKNGILHIVEMDKEVFEVQQTQWSKLVPKHQKRVKLHYGEFFEESIKILSTGAGTSAKSYFLDFDACITFEKCWPTYQPLDDFLAVLSEKSSRVFFSTTHSQRRSKRELMMNAVFNDFPQLFAEYGFICTRALPIPYADHTPMMTSLMSFVRPSRWYVWRAKERKAA